MSSKFHPSKKHGFRNLFSSNRKKKADEVEEPQQATAAAVDAAPTESHVLIEDRLLPAKQNETTTPVKELSKVDPVGERSREPHQREPVSSGPSDPQPTPSNALAVAINRQLSQLSEEERVAFRAATDEISDVSLLTKVKEFDEEHSQSSVVRKTAGPLGVFMGALNRFLDVISVAGQANPELALAVGAVKVVIGIGLDFLSFFGKLSDMMCRFGDFLGPLAEYASLPVEQKVLQDALVDAYGDLLIFCRKSRAVFMDKSGKKREWVSCRTFWRVQWTPFEDEFGGIEENLKHHLTVLGHASSSVGLSATLSVERQTKVDVRESFLNWLSSGSQEERHYEHYKRKHPGTGDWLVESDQFQSWFHSTTSQLLWCSGGPQLELAKQSLRLFLPLALTIATNLALTPQQVQCRGIHLPSASAAAQLWCCVYYFDYKDRQSPSGAEAPSSVTCSLLKQLCRMADSIPSGFLKTKQDALPPAMLGSPESFALMAQTHAEDFVIFDALDEYAEEQRRDVIDFIRSALEAAPKVKIFVTSRREPDIETRFLAFDPPCVRIEARSSLADITAYVQDVVKQRKQKGELSIRDPELTKEVIRTLIENAGGMFLWVVLRLDLVCLLSRSRKDSQVRKALAAPPGDLYETYLRIIEHIDSQPDYERKLATDCLTWVLFARRSLTIDELRYAIAAVNAHDDESEIELDDTDVIIWACGNLVALTSWRQGRIKPLQLTHYSVEEFLRKPPPASAINSTILQTLQDNADRHLALTRTCLVYLLDQAASVLSKGPCTKPADFKQRLESAPFLLYAAQHFDNHAAKGGPLSDELLEMIQSVLSKTGASLAAIVQIRETFKQPRTTYQRYLVDGTLYVDDLRRAAMGKLPGTVSVAEFVCATRLCEMARFDDKWKKDASSLKLYPLHRASRAGRMPMVSNLAGAGIDINTNDEQGRPPLYHAAWAGHADVVRYLLQSGASWDPEVAGTRNELLVAVLNDYWEVAALLVDSISSVDQKQRLLTRALWRASQKCSLPMVKWLIDMCADADTPIDPSAKLLPAAGAINGNHAIFQVLLANGADRSTLGTALLEAIRCNSIEIVDIILNEGLSVDHNADANEGTPLQIAAAEGHLDMVQHLIQKGSDVNWRGGRFGTALQAAAFGGYDEIVRTLLAADADVNAEGGEWGSALHAAATGHSGAVRILLDAGAAVNATSGDFGSALQTACFKSADVNLVRLLIARGADVNAAGAKYGSALNAAMRSDRRDQQILDLLQSPGEK